MKKVVACIIVLALFAACTPAFAAQTQKGASTQALEKASDEAVFHRIGDWFATIGKTDAEKKQIIAERKAKRVAIRAQKEAAKAQKELEKQMKKTQETIKQQMKQTQGKMGK